MRTALVVSLLSLSLTGVASAAKFTPPGSPRVKPATRTKGYLGPARKAIGKMLNFHAAAAAYSSGPIGLVKPGRVHIKTEKVTPITGRVRVREVAFGYKNAGAHKWAGRARLGELLSPDGKTVQKTVLLKRGTTITERPAPMTLPPGPPPIGPNGPILPTH